MKKTIAEIINEAAAMPSVADRAAHLAKYDHIALRTILKMAFDKSIKWLLPEGAPPFKKSEFDEPGIMYAEIRRLYLFMDGRAPGISQAKREQLFVEILEMVTPADAEMLIALKDGKMPKGITASVVKKAFPDLL